MENKCNYVCSRGLLKSCVFHSANPMSSWCYDFEHLNSMINGTDMRDGMSIYVCSDMVPHFIDNILPRISNTFFLVSGDSDATVFGGIIDIWGNNPRPIELEQCLRLANHPNLLKWFSQNCIIIHDKIEQMPIGLDYHTIANDPNKPWRGENEGTSPSDQESILNGIKNNGKPFYDRIHKIFVNFSVNLNNENDERTRAIKNISSDILHLDLDFTVRSNVWKKAIEYAFVLSPFGAGPDCHRTWEALCLGCIPIVKSMGSNKMYEDLPVLIINEWNEVNEELLNATIERFKTTTFNYDKLLLKYWVDKFSLVGPIKEMRITNNAPLPLVNPFEIDVINKEDYDNNELCEIQKKLIEKQESVNNLIKNTYPSGDENYKIGLDLMLNRCTKGVVQKLIDVENGVFPTKALYKIGNGGNKKNCFVCCTPLSNDRDAKSRNIHQSLENVGFNGYFYLFNGGFPNPTGAEMRYAAVPYCFKIFMMVEANKLGFEKVIWLDAACYAVDNPQRLFDVLETDDAIFRQFLPYTPGFLTYENTVFKETIQILNNVTNGDLVNSINVCSIVFGLNFVSDKINKFIEEYYEMVKIGTPFLSYYPEEVVITALFNKEEYKYLFYNRNESLFLFIHEDYVGNNYEHAKNSGYYFVQRAY